MKDKQSRKAAFYATAAALVWGLSFSFQRVAAEYIGPFSFQMARNAAAAICLWALTALRRKRGVAPCAPGKEKELILSGIICGVVLFSATSCQQIGIINTTASMASFLTALYIVLVPVLAAVFLHRRIGPLVWAGEAVAVLGLYFISVAPGGWSIGGGELWIMACALLFAVHILTVEHFIPGKDPVALSCIQFWTVSVLDLLGMLLTRENPTWANFRACLGGILYVGVFSGAGGYTLQIAAQKAGNTVAVSLLFSLESVFGLLGGVLILGERLSLRQGIGCALVFVAVILTQLVETEPKELKSPL